MPVSPPRPKGPPLNALRAFEAAARLGGIARAADELCVTPGAVSHHIRTLEDWAGLALFDRRSQGVRLTPAGASIVAGFTAAFDQLGLALHDLRLTRPKPAINIAALPSVAQLWLPARLPALRKSLTATGISVFALEQPPNLRREQFDCSIFIRRPEETKTGIVLAEDLIFPVCAPELAGRLHAPADLAGETLLHDGVWIDDWTLWAAHTATPLSAPTEGPSYSLYSIAVEEAKSGAGVLIGHQCLVEAALNSGDLVRPFPLSAPTGKALVLDVPARPAAENGAAAFIRTLVAHGRQSSTDPTA